MALTVTASATGKDTSGVTNRTIVLNVPTGTNRKIIALGMITGEAADPGTLTSVTFAGSAMTLVDYNQYAASFRSFYYYYDYPDGSASGNQNFYAAWTQSGRFHGAVVCIQPDITGAPKALASGTALTLSSITSAVADLIVGIICSNGDGVPASPGAGQTSVLAANTAADYGSVGVSYKTGTSTSESMSWTSSTGTIRHLAVSYSPVTGGGLMLFSS